MATGIKDKVAIIGMGCTKFGERWDVGAEELMVEAFQEAIQDAGIDKNEIQAAWLGTCFDEVNRPDDFLYELEKIVAQRHRVMPEGSYTTHLFKKGINKIAQKVGEEATEVVIEAIDDNKERLLEESADLLYHLIVLLQAKDLTLNDVSDVLRKRHK